MNGFFSANGPLANMSTLEFALILVIGGLLFVMGMRARQVRSQMQTSEAAVEKKLEELTALQSQLVGRLATMTEVFGERHSELGRALSDRMDGLTHRIGQSVQSSTQSTHENLSKLHERLGLIDRAQATISNLSQEVSGLNSILSDKQLRGVYGQGQMEAIIADALPKGSYTFQATLSNNKRPDCVIEMPNGLPRLVIDAKFPLEGLLAWHEALRSQDPLAAASSRVRSDVTRHINDISQKYFIPGETQDTAFLYVPSESVFADLHEHFPDLIQKAHKSRVVVVSPALLRLSIQLVQSIMRDARMHKEARTIQMEVARLHEDILRMDERTEKLGQHLSLAHKVLESVRLSSGKIIRRSQRIESMEISGEMHEAEHLASKPESEEVTSRMEALFVADAAASD